MVCVQNWNKGINHNIILYEKDIGNGRDIAIATDKTRFPLEMVFGTLLQRYSPSIFYEGKFLIQDTVVFFIELELSCYDSKQTNH